MASMRSNHLANYSLEVFAGGTALAEGTAKTEPKGIFMVTCPSCGHTADEYDFIDPENDAPDLEDVLYCPECEHAFEES